MKGSNYNLIDTVQKLAQEEEQRGSRDIKNLQNKFAIRHFLRMAEEIASCCGRRAKVLDWGCGYGHMTFFYLIWESKLYPAISASHY